MNTLYCTLQFEDKHIIVGKIQQYNHNNDIKISASKNNSSRTYQSLDLLVTLPEMNKVSRNR